MLFFKDFKFSQIIALFSVVLFSFWIILVVETAPLYQEAARTDALAMINVLLPSFWVILLAYVGICFVYVVKSNGPTWLHMLLIGQLSLILYFSPFVLSGFSWSPDSLWHAGVARYMPQILSGSDIALSNYAQTYPFSFLITYFAEQILGISVFTYTLYIYPLIACLVIAELAYVFAARVTNNQVAFLAMLFTLPALHYFEPHVSPFSTGTILVLVSLILLTVKSRFALSLSLLSVIVLTLTHPISPLSLGAYIFAYVMVGVIFKGEFSKNIFFSRDFLVPLLFFLAIIWFSWTFFYAMSYYYGLEIALLNVFNFEFLARFFNVTQFTVGGQGFIFPEIHELSLAIYGFFLIIVLIPVVEYLRQIFSSRARRTLESSFFDKLALSFAAIINAVLGFMLFLSSGDRVLLGRGLFYFVFMASIVTATYFVGLNKVGLNVKKILALGLVVTLFCSFPFISYSKEAYNSFTPSSNAGLEFLSSHVDLSNNSFSMGYDQQLAAYLDLSQGLGVSTQFPPNITSIDSPNVIVMRVNYYFLISMRSDLSFSNNSYTMLMDNLIMNSSYDKVYSNPNFEVFLK